MDQAPLDTFVLNFGPWPDPGQGGRQQPITDRVHPATRLAVKKAKGSAASRARLACLGHSSDHAGLQPDLVNIDGDHRFESVLADLQSALDLFPQATIVGDNWDWESVRTAVQTVAKDRGLKCQSHGAGWRIVS